LAWQNDTKIWKAAPNASSNAQTHVILFSDILIPGDSPQAQENIWRHQPWISQTRILLLGHHGSQTSTSQELLRALPRLKLGISSARWARYHHPHSAVELRLRKANVPLIRTEDWGNIWLEQNSY
jgi:competence protein ComEC